MLQTYWSNRSAAYCALKDYDRAERDARQCVKLQSGWSKGWSRLGAALFGGEDFEGSITAYEKGTLRKIDESVSISLITWVLLILKRH